MTYPSRVYVSGLGPNVSQTELRKQFEKHGPIVSVWISRNPPGHALVFFLEPRDAEDAVKEMNGSEVCCAQIRVERAHPSPRLPRYRRRPRPWSPLLNSLIQRDRSRSPRRSPMRRGRSRSPEVFFQEKRSSKVPHAEGLKVPAALYRTQRSFEVGHIERFNVPVVPSHGRWFKVAPIFSREQKSLKSPYTERSWSFRKTDCSVPCLYI